MRKIILAVIGVASLMMSGIHAETNSPSDREINAQLIQLPSYEKVTNAWAEVIRQRKESMTNLSPYVVGSYRAYMARKGLIPVPIETGESITGRAKTTNEIMLEQLDFPEAFTILKEAPASLVVNGPAGKDNPFYTVFVSEREACARNKRRFVHSCQAMKKDFASMALLLRLTAE